MSLVISIGAALLSKVFMIPISMYTPMGLRGIAVLYLIMEESLRMEEKSEVCDKFKDILRTLGLQTLPFMKLALTQPISFILSKMTLSYALRSAVAAIMSRNMSHNIGSHVLAYLKMEKLVDLMARLIIKNATDCQQFKGLIERITDISMSLQDCLNEIQNNCQNAQAKVEEIKQKISEIENILKNSTSSDLRWDLQNGLRIQRFSLVIYSTGWIFLLRFRQNGQNGLSPHI